MKNFSPIRSSNFEIRMAELHDLEELYRLRYKELLLAYNENNTNETEIFVDEYDEKCDNLIVVDLQENKIVGAYRLIKKEYLTNEKSFFTESEFDISKIKQYNILEIGRAFVQENYRHGAVIMQLWRGIIRYAVTENIKYIFGTASFHGVDPLSYSHALSYLYYNHLSPSEIRAHAIGNRFDLNILPPESIDMDLVKKQMPALIKGYLKIGSTFGEDGFIDIPFNSIDVLVILDVENVNPRYLNRFLY